MKPLSLFFAILLWSGLAAEDVVAEEAPLGLHEAVALAIENDPMLASIAERRRAMQDLSVAEWQLPDPRIKIAGTNLPVTSFDIKQEPMTQFQLGISQRIPRGDTLRFRGNRAEARADIANNRQQARLAATILETRQAWLSVGYWISAKKILAEQHTALEELMNVTRDHYAEGGGQQQDVLRAQLELSLLTDKILNADRELENARATLSRWIGAKMASRTINSNHVVLGELRQGAQIRNAIPSHPAIGISDAEIAVHRSEVGLARQAYKPEWGVDITYGARAGDPLGRSRADFVSVMVNFDVPLFTGKRQDKRLSAARRNEAASRFERDEQVRRLEQMFDAAWADWRTTKDRLNLYEGQILENSNETYAVTMNAYRNDVTDFALLIRARLLDFDTRLKALRLRTDHLLAQARLLYLQGEG